MALECNYYRRCMHEHVYTCGKGRTSHCECSLNEYSPGRRSAVIDLGFDTDVNSSPHFRSSYGQHHPVISHLVSWYHSPLKKVLCVHFTDEDTEVLRGELPSSLLHGIKTCVLPALILILPLDDNELQDIHG